MELGGVLLKRSYISPEIDVVKIKLRDVICISPPTGAETPIDDAIVIDDSDDF